MIYHAYRPCKINMEGGPERIFHAGPRIQMTEIYPATDAKRMKRSLPWLRFAALFFLLGGIVACILLCIGVTTGNAARRQWTVVLIAILSGWAFLLIRSLAVKPLSARLQHFEGILNETEPAKTREGVFLSADAKLTIPGSITVRKVRFRFETGEETLNILADKASLLPAPGAAVTVRTIRTFVAGIGGCDA